MPPAPIRAPLSNNPSQANQNMGAAGTPAASAAIPSGAAKDQYETLRKQLRDLISKKKHSDKLLETLEDHIYKYETTYLEDTQNGNIVRGFDNYIKGTVARRRANITDQDRIFSSSSYSYMKSREEGSNAGTPSGSVPPESTTSSTPSFTKNGTSGGLPKKLASTLKKKRKGGAADDDSESHSEIETPGPKRVRISFSGQNSDK
ncbi:Chromatin modification-related protein EAF6 [Drechslerella dactyloides]|uniref:Chromatin modification-related protein EAF6 n=1 Tax=Drechslerella dactyloides TaxID=74499 RepID=A0AAD6NL44_DREDA|nr:Chromatin modification-related protein EAF6 [Drechslerella dactyloides]